MAIEGMNDRDVPDLDTATDEELWEEIKRRNSTAILATSKPDNDPDLPDRITIEHHGSFATCIGLATVARKLILKDLLSTFEEDDGR